MRNTTNPQRQMKRTREERIGTTERDKHVRVNDPSDELFPGEEEDEGTQNRQGISIGKEDGELDWRQVGEQHYSKADRETLEAHEQEVEPFDLSDERALGTFDEHGSFTWTRRDLEEEGDTAWIEQVGDQIAATNRPASQQKAPAYSDDSKIDIPTTIWKAVKHLSPGETPFLALRRVRHVKSDFEELTDSCALLLREGLTDVYSLSRELLVRKLPQIQWEYRVENRDEVHGPFAGHEMQEWRNDGFFLSDSSDKCFVRHYGTERWKAGEEVATFLLPLDGSQTVRKQHEDG